MNVSREIKIVAMELEAASDLQYAADAKWAIEWLVNEYGLRKVSVKDVVDAMDNPPPAAKAKKVVQMGLVDYNSEFRPTVKMAKDLADEDLRTGAGTMMRQIARMGGVRTVKFRRVQDGVAYLEVQLWRDDDGYPEINKKNFFRKIYRMAKKLGVWIRKDTYDEIDFDAEGQLWFMIELVLI